VINKKVYGKQCQQFVFSKQTKTIDSVCRKGQSITADGSNLVIKTTDARWYQLWKYTKPYFTNIKETTKTWDIAGGKDADGTNVIVYTKNTGGSQKWTIVYVDEDKKDAGKGELAEDFGLYVERPFHIVSQMSSNRYVDLISNRLVIKTPNGRDSQVWYFDYKSSTIKSKTNNQSIDMRNNYLYIYGTNSQWYQVWRYEKEQFINQNGKAMEAYQAKDEEGQYLHASNRQNSAHQKWKVVYLDKKADEQTTGDNTDFGFSINRPFYIISKSYMNRGLYANSNQ
jgi:hypothetical protein